MLKIEVDVHGKFIVVIQRLGEEGKFTTQMYGVFPSRRQDQNILKIQGY